MSDVLQFLRKSALIFGSSPDKSKVEQQIEELQNSTPTMAHTSNGDGSLDIIATLMKSKTKDKSPDSLSEDTQTPFEYRGENPNAKSEGLDSGIEMAGLGGSVNKISSATKDRKTMSKKVGTKNLKGHKVLLRTPASVKLSSFMGGLLSGFDKAGSYPDVDPGLLFDELVSRMPTEATLEEKAEVKAAFVGNWNR